MSSKPSDLNILDHGTWIPYQPVDYPPNVPHDVLFWRNKDTGADWYTYSRKTWQVTGGVDSTGTLKVLLDDKNTVISFGRDVTGMSPPGHLIELPDAGAVPPPYGARLIDGRFVPREELPGPIPETMERWQFFAALAGAGIITEPEAQDAIAGPLPAKLTAFAATLPQSQRFPATMMFKGSPYFERRNPLTQAFLAAGGLTPAQADALWRTGAALGA